MNGTFTEVFDITDKLKSIQQPLHSHTCTSTKTSEFQTTFVLKTWSTLEDMLRYLHFEKK